MIEDSVHRDRYKAIRRLRVDLDFGEFTRLRSQLKNINIYRITTMIGHNAVIYYCCERDLLLADLILGEFYEQS